MTFAPPTVITLATQLVRPLARVDASAWDECEEARARSAASRAYYGVYLLLKQRVGPHSGRILTERFDVHSLMRQAVSALGRHTLPNRLKELFDARKNADYEIGTSFDADQANDIVRLAELVRADIDVLSDWQLMQIGARFDLKAEEAERRRSRRF